MLDVRVVDASVVDELVEHADAWDDLALASPERMPVLSHAWVASFLENAAPSRRWRCLFAYEGHRLVGVLPVQRVRQRVPGVRLAGTLGSDLHTYSAYPLLDPAHARPALSALLARLEALEPGYLWLRLAGVRGDAVVRSVARLEGVRLSGVPAAHWRRTGSILPVAGALEDHERGLSANFRRNLRKARNRCEREHEVSFRFLTGRAASSQEPFDRFLDLEASGWKGRAGTGIRCDPRLVRFYSTLCARMGRRGWLQWHFLELDGTLVAGHLAIRFGPSLVLLKIAYDEERARLGPGSLLFAETVARSFADAGLREINCLSDTPWHRNWRMSTVRYGDLVVTPDRAVPRLAGQLEVSGPALARRTASRAWRAVADRAANRGRRALAG